MKTGVYIIEVMPNANPHGLFYVPVEPGIFLWKSESAAKERAAKEIATRNATEDVVTVSIRGPLFSK